MLSQFYQKFDIYFSKREKRHYHWRHAWFYFASTEYVLERVYHRKLTL